MRLTQFTDYSLRTLIYLGIKNDRATVSEIAQAFGISRNHLVKVANRLATLGFIESYKGRQGGISLGKDPKEILVGNLVAQLEPDMHLAECFNKKKKACSLVGFCELERVLYKANKSFLSTLNQHSLADLLQSKDLARQKLLLSIK